MRRAHPVSRPILAAVALAAGLAAASPGHATCSFYREPGFSGPSLALNPGMREDRLRAYMPHVGSLKASQGCRAVLIGEETQAFSGSARRVSEPFRSQSEAAACECGSVSAAPRKSAPETAEATPKSDVKPKAEAKAEPVIETKPAVATTRRAEEKPPAEQRRETAARAKPEEIAPRARRAAAPDEAPAPDEAEALRDEPVVADRERWVQEDRVAPDQRLALAEPNAPEPVAGCLLFSERGFGGDLFEMAPGESLPDLRRAGFDNSAVSVSVAPGCEVTLWSHPDFRGPSESWGGEVVAIGSRLRGAASSASCDCVPDGGAEPAPEAYEPPPAYVAPRRGAGLPPPPLDPRGAACIAYSDPGFQGVWRAYRDGAENSRLGRELRDEVSSIEVARGCAVVVDLGGGYRTVFEGSVEWLDRGADDRARAVSCYCGRY